MSSKINKGVGMKFLVCSDFHLTDQRPKSRLDASYFHTGMSKLQEILEFAAKNKIEYILQAGDFFDTHRASDFIKQKVIQLLLMYKREHNITMCVVFGQHDLRFHNSDIENTPLKVLEQAGAVVLLKPDTPYFCEEDIAVYGASWNEEPTDQLDESKINVLVTHRMVIQNKLWEHQEGAVFVNNLFRQFKHDYILTGDNHQHFTSSVSPAKGKKRYAINCGSLLRSNITQLQHKPCFYLVDTAQNTIKQHYLTVKDIETIMRVDEAVEEKVVNEELIAFIETVQDGEAIAGVDLISFIQNIRKQAEAAEAPVRKAIENILTQVELAN
jgi:DNA repair exonuclease SbcCD nuclease subunit